MGRQGGAKIGAHAQLSIEVKTQPPQTALALKKQTMPSSSGNLGHRLRSAGENLQQHSQQAGNLQRLAWIHPQQLVGLMDLNARHLCVMFDADLWVSLASASNLGLISFAPSGQFCFGGFVPDTGVSG